MTAQKPASTNYQKQLLLLFVFSVICGSILLSFNRTTYNMWFLGLEKSQWNFWPTGMISMSELIDYWNWIPGRTLMLLCLFPWFIALASVVLMLVLSWKTSRKSG